MTATQPVLSRRAFIGTSAIAVASLATVGAPSANAEGRLSSEDGVAPTKVRFDSGDSFIVGNLYLPGDYDDGSQYPAVVVAGSLTSVKEQMGGVYALEMSRRGFMALALDYRHYGESGGEPRQYEDPEAKALDLSAALTYLASRADVRSDGLLLLGVCTSGGTVLYTAARDERVAAVACVASHLAEPSITPALYGGEEGVASRREAAKTARAAYEATGENELILAYHNTDTTASHLGPMPYYMDQTRGGGVAAWTNAFAVMSWDNWLDFDPVSQAAGVTIPTLIVHTDLCALPEQARKTYAALKGPKTLHWTTGDHFEFYDGPEKVGEAVEVAAQHFRRHLA